jgi:hypothetical protein
LRGLDPTDLELDLPVRAEIERVNDEFARVYFRPAPETRKTETRKTETRKTET